MKAFSHFWIILQNSDIHLQSWDCFQICNLSNLDFREELHLRTTVIKRIPPKNKPYFFKKIQWVVQTRVCEASELFIEKEITVAVIRKACNEYIY